MLRVWDNESEILQCVDREREVEVSNCWLYLKLTQQGSRTQIATRNQSLTYSWVAKAEKGSCKPSLKYPHSRLVLGWFAIEAECSIGSSKVVGADWVRAQ